MSATATHVKDRLLELTYGELSSDEARQVETHVEECPSCRQALDEIRGVRRVMSRLSQPPAPQDKLESLLAYAEQAARRANAGTAPKARWWSKWLVPVGGIAAAVTFGIVAHEVSKGPALQNPAEQVLREKLGATPAVPMAAAKEIDSPAEPTMAGEPSATARTPLVVEEASPGLVRHSMKDEMAQMFGASPDATKTELAQRPAAPKPKPAMPRRETERAQQRVAALEGKKKAFAEPDGWAANAAGRGGVRAPNEPSPEPQLQRAEERKRGSAAGAIEKNAGLSTTGVAEGRAADVAVPEAKAARPNRTAAVANRSAAESPAEYSSAAVAATRSDSESAPPAAASPAPRSVSKSVDMPVVAAEAMSESANRGPSQDDAARSRAEALSQQAVAAQRSGSRPQEVAYLRQALATGVRDQALVTNLLLRLCDAQLALGNIAAGEAACERVIREFPSTGAAKVASQRLTESRAGRAKAQPAAPTTVAPAETH